MGLMNQQFRDTTKKQKVKELLSHLKQALEEDKDLIIFIAKFEKKRIFSRQRQYNAKLYMDHVARDEATDAFNQSLNEIEGSCTINEN